MTELLIAPINVKSKGGYRVRITGLNPTDHDCIVGEITPPSGPIQARWNLSGLMRNGSDECNLVMNSEELSDLKLTAEKLWADKC